METAESSSMSTARPEKSGYDELPKEMNEMKIRENKYANRDEKVKSSIVELFCFSSLYLVIL